MSINSSKLLVVYSAVLTLAAVLVIGTGAIAPSKVASFDEIDVQRINLREKDGTLRMTIANSDKAPGLIFRGVEKPHPSGRREAGILFFNDEGTENGGLSWGGKKGPDGKVRSGGHLSFDQYEQDQVIQLTQSEYDGRRWAAMVINDRPDEPIAIDLAHRISSMPDGPEKTAMLNKVKEDGTFGRQRMFVGKTSNKESAVMLSDAKARPRILMKVSPDGEASIDFLDENGKVVRSLSPTSK